MTNKVMKIFSIATIISNLILMPLYEMAIYDPWSFPVIDAYLLGSLLFLAPVMSIMVIGFHAFDKQEAKWARGMKIISSIAVIIANLLFIVTSFVSIYWLEFQYQNTVDDLFDVMIFLTPITNIVIIGFLILVKRGIA